MSSLLAPERSTHATPVTAGPSTIARGSFAPDAARWLLAASGFLMLAFVFAHLVGNLRAFAGASAFNDYAHSLRQLGTPLLPESGVLWAARVALAGALVIHLGSHLYIMTRPDGPSALTVRPSDALPPWYATLPVAVFQVSGALMLAFVAFHLAQLTFGPSILPSSRRIRTTIRLLPCGSGRCPWRTFAQPLRSQCICCPVHGPDYVRWDSYEPAPYGWQALSHQQ
jgi:succinate dehydrogenase / fumarate reductase, cytochrome b subunit